MNEVVHLCRRASIRCWRRGCTFSRTERTRFGSPSLSSCARYALPPPHAYAATRVTPISHVGIRVCACPSARQEVLR